MIVKTKRQQLGEVCIYLAGFMGVMLPPAFIGVLAIHLTAIDWVGSILGGVLFIFQLYFLPKINEL